MVLKFFGGDKKRKDSVETKSKLETKPVSGLVSNPEISSTNKRSPSPNNQQRRNYGAADLRKDIKLHQDLFNHLGMLSINDLATKADVNHINNFIKEHEMDTNRPMNAKGETIKSSLEKVENRVKEKSSPSYNPDGDPEKDYGVMPSIDPKTGNVISKTTENQNKSVYSEAKKRTPPPPPNEKPSQFNPDFEAFSNETKIGLLKDEGYSPMPSPKEYKIDHAKLPPPIPPRNPSQDNPDFVELDPDLKAIATTLKSSGLATTASNKPGQEKTTQTRPTQTPATDRGHTPAGRG